MVYASKCQIQNLLNILNIFRSPKGSVQTYISYKVELNCKIILSCRKAVEAIDFSDGNMIKETLNYITLPLTFHGSAEKVPGRDTREDISFLCKKCFK